MDRRGARRPPGSPSPYRRRQEQARSSHPEIQRRSDPILGGSLPGLRLPVPGHPAWATHGGHIVVASAVQFAHCPLNVRGVATRRPRGLCRLFQGAVHRHPTRRPGGTPQRQACLAGLFNRSRSRAIRKDVTASGSRTGPLYVTRINEFAAKIWNVAEGESASDSLRRAVVRIRQIPVAPVRSD